MIVSKHLPFFDPDKARGPSDRPDVGEDVTDKILAGAASGPVSVSALIAQIKGALARAFPSPVTVVGELSNVKLHTSGHIYFRLKDAAASIDAMMFRGRASKLKFTPTDGLEVVVDGRVDVYDVRGQLQFYAERMTPKGAGALELAFRQLREKLQAEGLFDPDRKKPIPRFPRAIGVVTSQTGAAIRDIRRTLTRRWPAADVYLLPVLVQGEVAAGQIAEAIALLDANSERFSIDTIIIARGGGSLEDLWAFNEEPVARAIFAARTPIISGVGHEVDVSIADLAADLRAPTPTGAAELATPNAEEIRAHVAQLHSRLRRTVAGELQRAAAALEAVGRTAVFRDPKSRLRTGTQHVDELAHRLRAGVRERLADSRGALAPVANSLAALHPAMQAERAKAKLSQLRSGLAWALNANRKRAGDELTDLAKRLAGAHPRHRLAVAKQQVAGVAKQLEAMSYRKVLTRGFSVTRTPAGDILRSTRDATAGLEIQTELADGKFHSIVAGGPGQAKPKPPTPLRGKTSKANKTGQQGTLFD